MRRPGNSGNAFSLYELDDKMSPRGISADLILQPGETFQLVGLNESYLEGFFRDQLSDEEKAAVLGGEGCVVRNPLSVSAGEERLAGNICKGRKYDYRRRKAASRH